MSVFRDVGEPTRAERAYQFLAEATTRLIAALDSEETPSTLAALVVPALADWCTIVLIGPDGWPQLAAHRHADPQQAALVAALWQRTFIELQSQHGMSTVLDSQQSELVMEVPELTREAVGDAEVWRLVQALQPRSHLIVPLVARGHALGTLTLSTTGARRLDREDLALVEELARRAALVIDNVQLYAAERVVRQTADRTIANLSALQRVTAAFAQALTPAQVAEVVVQQGLQSLGAVAGMLARLDDASAELVSLGVVGYSPETIQSFQRFPLQADVPLARAVRTGQMLLIETTAERIAQFPNLGTTPRPDGLGALACLPLISEGHIIGGLALNFRQERQFTSEELALMQAFAQLSAQALERTRLYEAERQAHAAAETARQQLALLSDASRVLASSLDYATTLSQVAQLVVPRHADWCGVYIVDAAGTAQPVALAHVDPAKVVLAEELYRRYPPDPDAPSGILHVIRTGRSEYLADLPAELLDSSAHDAEHARLLKMLGLKSYLIVPLVARERVLGAIYLVSAESGQSYGPAEVAFSEELASRAALAIDNARLYQAAQQANTELEQRVAERTAELRRLSAHLQTAREEERAALARELHDELGQILTVAKFEVRHLANRVARAGEPPSSLSTTIREGLEQFEKTLDDSLRAVRTLVTELRPALLDEFGLEAALEWQVQQFQERTGIACQFDAQVDELAWDPQRGLTLFRILQESLTNVARHAQATRVAVQLQADAAQLRLEVRDNGRGISAADLSKAQHFGLLGMRERVALLGGDIQIQGAAGQGTVVTVRTPLG